MRTVFGLIALCLTWGPLAAQTTESADTLAARLGAYLEQYERELSTVMAREVYRQSETSFRPQRDIANAIFRNRTLHSDVAFLRLPGDGEWFGVRHVLRVDRRNVNAEGSLAKSLAATRANLEETVRAIVVASSKHNLGAERTINMPTVPLEILHPRHRERIVFTLGDEETIAGTRTRELRYREDSDRALIRDQEARQLLARGSAWVDAEGRLWRVTLRLEHAHQAVMNGRTGDNLLRVDFVHNGELNLLVPHEMREEFDVRGGGQFKGRATYSEYRRFTTGARIIPQ
jgi:hypothetical protein